MKNSISMYKKTYNINFKFLGMYNFKKKIAMS